MQLTSQYVETVFKDCLWQETNGLSQEELIALSVVVKGITNKFGFPKDRLELHRQDIIDMLNELPSEFHEKGGGGWSFLNACEDKSGNQWTGEHRIMEQLFVLGMAIGAVQCLVPRELWAALPGGMPYYVITC